MSKSIEEQMLDRGRGLLEEVGDDPDFCMSTSDFVDFLMSDVNGRDMKQQGLTHHDCIVIARRVAECLL